MKYVIERPRMFTVLLWGELLWLELAFSYLNHLVIMLESIKVLSQALSNSYFIFYLLLPFHY